MADLTFLSEETVGTIDAINLRYEAKRQHRGYLGLSQAGHPCQRYLWFMHKGDPGKPIEGRVLRLFQLGNLLEDQIIADLRDIGCTVERQQEEVVFTQDDVRLVGHIDGVVTGLLEAPATPHLFEAKSASKKKFAELLKLGSYEKFNEQYRWQIQFYLLGLNLKRAVVFVYCKDDSALYMERIRLDKEATIEKLGSIFEAITSQDMPERKCPRVDYFEAKWCDFYKPCFFGGSEANPGKGKDPW